MDGLGNPLRYKFSICSRIDFAEEMQAERIDCKVFEDQWEMFPDRDRWRSPDHSEV